jgi:hypothetical protein
LEGLPVAAPVLLYACYAPNNATFFPACGTVAFNITERPTVVNTVSPTTAFNDSDAGPFTLTGYFGPNPTEPTVAFSKDPACPLESLMLYIPVTISGSGSTQTATISSVDFSDVSPIPADLFLCYSPNNSTFTPSPTAAKITITQEPCVDSMNPTTAVAGSVLSGGFSFTGVFGTSPAAPTIAFSTDPACPLEGLMLRRRATVASTGTVCCFTTCPIRSL